MAILKVLHVGADGVNPDRERRLIAVMTNDAEGIIDAGDFLVSEKSGTPDMSIDIAVGRALVTGTEATVQGVYMCETDAVTNLVIGDGDASNGRIDVVVAQVRDSDYTGVDDDWRLFVVAGTPAGSPVAPAIPDSSLKLAEVTVDALESTSILDADIDATFPSIWNPHYQSEIFTANGTFTKADYPWAKSVRVRVVGGGGGSGGIAATAATPTAALSAGGGGGGYSEARVPIGSVGTTETVTVGAAGAAGASGNNAGGAGGTSSFGSHCSATGGSGGAGSAAQDPAAGALVNQGGAGGAGSSGDLNLSGAPGEDGLISLAAAGAPIGGGGGESGGGMGARQPLNIATGFTATGTAGSSYGGGAAGEWELGAGAAEAGAAGAKGIVLVEVFG